MKRTLTALILIFAISLSAGQALAANAESASELSEATVEMQRFKLITVINPALLVSGTTASYSLIVTCISSVNSVSATLQIQQLSNGKWTDYGSSWNVPASSTYYLSTGGTRTVDSGYSYRLKADITASNGSTTEYVTSYS